LLLVHPVGIPELLQDFSSFFGFQLRDLDLPLNILQVLE
jgi:hypothetical protein